MKVKKSKSGNVLSRSFPRFVLSSIRGLFFFSLRAVWLPCALSRSCFPFHFIFSFWCFFVGPPSALRSDIATLTAYGHPRILSSYCIIFPFTFYLIDDAQSRGSFWYWLRIFLLFTMLREMFTFFKIMCV